MGLAALHVHENLAEVPLCVGPRSRPIDVPSRQEKGFSQAVHQTFLLSPESADPMVTESKPAHHSINPFRRGPVAVKPLFLLNVKCVFECDVSLLKQPDIEINIMLDRTKSMVADQHQRGIGW